MSGELHLDLCQQSTTHLKEVVAAIKENLRLLEVFLSSGLSEEERKFQANLFPGESGSDIGSGSLKDSKSNSAVLMHRGCCCMCPTRQARERAWISFRSEGRNSSSPVLSRSRQPSTPTQQRPVSMPRLNRTASLRRESAMERSQQRGESPQSHSSR